MTSFGRAQCEIRHPGCDAGGAGRAPL